MSLGRSVVGTHRSSWVALSGWSTRLIAQMVSRVSGVDSSFPAGIPTADSLDRGQDLQNLDERPEEADNAGPRGARGSNRVEEMPGSARLSRRLPFATKVSHELGLELSLPPIGAIHLEVDRVPDPAAADRRVVIGHLMTRYYRSVGSSRFWRGRLRPGGAWFSGVGRLPRYPGRSCRGR